jgi:anti-anti-sigma regulatory factor
MLRLTVLSQTPEEAVLKIEGWVTGEEVCLLAQEGARLLAASRRLVLELTGVVSIDAAGIVLLEQWAGDRLILRDGSPLIRRLLERHGLRCEGAQHMNP